jgi:hypothetical protein
MLMAKGCRARRVEGPAVAPEACGGVPATAMRRSNEEWIRTTKLGPRAEW